VSEQTDAEFPNAIEFAETALSLPIYPQLSHEEVDYVIKCVQSVLTGSGKR